jgi:hypothetical protein
LLVRRPTKVAAIAHANKIARMVWAMMARGERYKENYELFRQLISVRVSRNVLMQRRVLAGFHPQWPILKLGVAVFQIG